MSDSAMAMASSVEGAFRRSTEFSSRPLLLTVPRSADQQLKVAAALLVPVAPRANRSGRDENSVERRMRLPTDDAIAIAESDIAYPEFLDALLGPDHERLECAQWCTGGQPMGRVPWSDSRNRFRPPERYATVHPRVAPRSSAQLCRAAKIV